MVRSILLAMGAWMGVAALVAGAEPTDTELLQELNSLKQQQAELSLRIKHLESKLTEKQTSEKVAPEKLNAQLWDQLGIRVEELATRDSLPAKYRGGMKIVEIRDRGPALMTGLKTGDVLVGLRDWETTSLNGIRWILAQDRWTSTNRVNFVALRGTQILYGDVEVQRSAASVND